MQTIQSMGGGALRPPPTVVFCPLLTKSKGSPYMKSLDFSQLFVADALRKKNNSVEPPLRALLLWVAKIVMRQRVTT